MIKNSTYLLGGKLVRKQKLIVSILLMLLWLNVTTSAYAAEGNNDDKSKTVATAVNTDKSSEAKPTTPSTEEQLNILNDKVRRLEELVERQQHIIEALQPKIATTTVSNTLTNASVTDAVNPGGNPIVATTAPITSTAPSSSTTSQAPTVTDDQVKHLDSLYKAFGNITFSGDFRVRYEGFFNQGFDAPTQSPDRNRLVVRARLQLAGRINKNLDYGLRLATGSFTNPIGTNQTATDFFNRKPVGFDNYFIRYDSKPDQGVGVTLQAGKFDYPWKRTELTFDNDLQPEGAAETIYYKGKNFLKDARIIAFQLPFNEVSAGKDSGLFGGQLQATVGKDDFGFTGAVTYLNFNQADAIARALSKPSTQVGGGLEFGTTNRVRRDAMGNIIGFVSNYNIVEFLGEGRYTKYKKFPITVVLDYTRNLSERLDKLKERNGYWAELKVGSTKEKGDIQFGYLFNRIEQDAVLSVFNYSDQLATNSRTNRFSLAYAVHSNVFFQFTGIFSQRFNTVPNVKDNRVLRRIQMDINYRF